MAILYKVTHSPSDRVYYGVIWASGKTVEQRLNEHLTGRGSVYIQRLIENGSSLNDFTAITLMIADKNFCLEIEKKLALTSQYPIGLNGNAGNSVNFTEDARKIMSKKAKSRQLKLSAAGLGNFCGKQGSEIARRTNQIRKETGALQQQGRDSANNRVSAGTHNWQDRKLAKERAQQRVIDGSHPFQGSVGSLRARERNQRWMAEGKHPCQVKIECIYCGKIIPKSIHTRCHGIKCKEFKS